jgi:molecular chaperone GrpE
LAKRKKGKLVTEAQQDHPEDRPLVSADAEPAPNHTQTRPLAQQETASPPEAPDASEVGAETTDEADASLSDPLEALEAELAEARGLADEYLDGWQRSRAEFANYKKRVDRELETAYTAAAAQVLARYLPVIDDIERALKEHPEPTEIEAWTAGIELIHRKLLDVLDAEGVEKVPSEGQVFDPNLHEAISFEASDGFEEGHIIEVIREGYRLGDRILRPAMVRVAR